MKFDSYREKVLRHIAMVAKFLDDNKPIQFSHQISDYHFSRFRLLNFFCPVTNRASGIFG